MDSTISIKDIFQILKKRWNLILLITLFFTLLGITITYYFITPIYPASTQILVNQKNLENKIDLSQIRNNVELINTYSVIIKSPAILDKVIDKLEISQNVEQLNQKITVNSQENSQVFSLTVTDSDPRRAVEIANSISETFQEEIKTLMSVDNVSIIAKAILKDNPIPVNPKPVLNITIAVVAGLITGIGLAIILDYLDNTLRDSHDVESYLGLPVLGSVQEMPKQKGKLDTTLHKKGVETLEA